MPAQNQPDSNDRDRPASGGQKDGQQNGQKDGESPRGSKAGGHGGGRNTPGGMPRNMLGWALMGGLLVMLLLVLNSSSSAEEKSWQDFYNLVTAGAFDGPVLVENDRLVGTVREGFPGREPKAKGTDQVYTPVQPDTRDFFLTKLDEAGQDFLAKPRSDLLLQLLLGWGPFILVALLVYWFLFRSIRNAGGGAGMLGNFGRSRHKVTTKEHSNVTFDDVAGIEEAKDEISEIVEFLKNPKKFQRLGGRVPRGVLLIGDPGVGKTLLAKAVAGEADVPFFSISGSDFVEMFVGVGASRVRDLFKQAKDNSPCIIFLDEIDAVGRRRGSGFSSGGHDEREQTLNAILVEMDGFETSDQVIVMAATNRSDVLDPALTRPGRFDRQIAVSLPDVKGRMEILKVHSKRVKMSPHVDLERLARGTPMFSGADLAAIINEAAIGATLANKDHVEQADLEEARDKVRWGRARRSHKIEDDEKKVIAYHEAGHALVMYYDDNAEPLHKVTIIPRGHALGATFNLPERDRHLYSRNQMISHIRVAFGGRVAEEMFCGDQYNGTAGDIRQATGIARSMVMQYGMSEKLGFQLLGHDEQRNPWEQPDRLYSDDTARQIDEEVRGILDDAYRHTRELMQTHREQVENLAQALLKYETLTADEVDRIMKGQTLAKPTVGDLLKAEQSKTTEAAPSPDADAARDEPLDDQGTGAMPSPA